MFGEKMNTTITQKIVRPDIKGRINLGKLIMGISGFKITINNNRSIILEPLVEIPAHEKWLFENKTVLKQVKQGIAAAAQGKLVSRGDFKQYLHEEIE